MSVRSVLFAATALLATANSHIIMEYPVPYSNDKIDNSPITAAQFPCKSQNGFTVTKMNPMKVGETLQTSFKGTAVHGGGSCQLSYTQDTTPTANSKFKVIKSIEGGCPGVDGTTKKFDFALPDAIPNGKGTFVWTWFSKMAGQPELYMNCAPIDVSGGASDASKLDTLPDTLFANINSKCKQVENKAIKFPNPGKEVQDGGLGDATAAPKPTGSAPVLAPGASSAAPTTLATVVAPSPPAGSASPPTATGAPSTGAPSTGAPSTGAPSTGAPSTGGASGSCSSDGAIVCNGTSQFGICNKGQVVWQAVAAGTQCANGVISKRGYNGRIARPRN
ncbi:lytic polysaccharide monooxygenase [Periconia macrospinosa]|uniref:Lytic polysaccharide monooxygenase n=1 Tax=Periconia macrospinosa TaxID=97972 RepID=A0A2V1DKP3_9PLEO|nr:lytic polysaccharide monooxygenase [Periconia macrospinosa]